MRGIWLQNRPNRPNRPRSRAPLLVAVGTWVDLLGRFCCAQPRIGRQNRPESVGLLEEAIEVWAVWVDWADPGMYRSVSHADSAAPLGCHRGPTRSCDSHHRSPSPP